jgi:chromosome segregation ATPase
MSGNTTVDILREHIAVQRARIVELEAEVDECQSHRCADKDRNNDQIRRIAQLERDLAEALRMERQEAQERTRLETALRRAMDTFEEMRAAMELLHRPLIAASCEIARDGCDDALSLENSCDGGGK